MKWGLKSSTQKASMHPQSLSKKKKKNERDERWVEGEEESSRVELPACWLMLIRRLINYQRNVLRGSISSSSSSKQRQLHVATCGNSVWHATFCCCLDICNGARKKIYIAFRRMRQGSPRRRRRWWWCWWGGSARRKSLACGRGSGRVSATINVTICDLCLAPASLTLWYLEFLRAHPVRSGDRRWQTSPWSDADDDCI